MQIRSYYMRLHKRLIIQIKSFEIKKKEQFIYLSVLINYSMLKIMKRSKMRMKTTMRKMWKMEMKNVVLTMMTLMTRKT